MKEIEMEAKTVAEAVELALKKLELRREQVEVQILQEPSSGFIGFGAKPARVRLTEKRWGASLPPLDPRRGPMPRRSGDYPPAELPSPSNGRSERQPRRDPQPRRQSAPAKEKPQARPQTQPSAARKEEPVLTQQQIDAASERSRELLGKILSLMGFEDATLELSWDPKQERLKADVRTADSRRLIGPEGRTLEALQFLVTLMVGRKLGAPVAVQVDCESFWAGRENAILSQALKGVESVRATGKPFRLEPMDAQMRRLIHRSLAGTPDIVTSSEGDGAWRKIVLRPAR